MLLRGWELCWLLLSGRRGEVSLPAGKHTAVLSGLTPPVFWAEMNAVLEHNSFLGAIPVNLSLN